MKRVLLGFALSCLINISVAVSDSEVTPQPTPTPSRVPGEEVTTGSGKKMRVWDTSGPVPVNTAAEAGTVPNRENLRVNDLNVWVGPGNVRRPVQPRQGGN